MLGSTSFDTASLSGAVDRIRFVVAPEPRCDLTLTDGTTATVSPDEAARLTTAAVTGVADAPGSSGISPDRVALGTAEGVRCAIERPRGLPLQQPEPGGLTPRAAALHEEVQATFGRVPYGGFAPEGVSTGHGIRSAHYEGRAIDYFFRPVGDEQQREAGWVLANWLAANAGRLEVAVVIFDDRIWSSRRSAEGWRPYTNPDGGTDPISRHLDHVHVDVVRGG